MRHVFKAQKLGYGDDKTEGVWFDADDYTKEEAEAEFKPYQGVTQKGYDYTGYEYDGGEVSSLHLPWGVQGQRYANKRCRSVAKVVIR